jgi:hypothetical protein
MTMAFGDPYTFDELARTLRISAPAQLTLTAAQLLDLLDARHACTFDDADISAAYDEGYADGYEKGARSAAPKTTAS